MARGDGETADIEVELCGRLADGLGPRVVLALPHAGVDVAALLALAGRQDAALEAQIAAGRVRACVNDTIVGSEGRVLPTDRVALFPPVSGG